MADRTAPSYGEPNWEMVGRWLHLPPEEDGPFWALNLMRYREKAIARARFDRVPDAAQADHAAAAPEGSHQVVVAPDRERLIESIVAPVAESV